MAYRGLKKPGRYVADAVSPGLQLSRSTAAAIGRSILPMRRPKKKTLDLRIADIRKHTENRVRSELRMLKTQNSADFAFKFRVMVQTLHGRA